MLREFGCACLPNLRPYNTRKLSFSSKRCAFLGYSNMHKGFKCPDIATGRIHISRDVDFNEQVFPFAALHDNASALLRSEIELRPPTLFDSSMLFGSTTIPAANVVNNSTNPVAHSNLNPEENPAAGPIFNAALQEGTGAQPEVYTPEPTPDPTSASLSESASAPANQQTVATRSVVPSNERVSLGSS
jgi:hypothetical protein